MSSNPHYIVEIGIIATSRTSMTSKRCIIASWKMRWKHRGSINKTSREHRMEARHRYIKNIDHIERVALISFASPAMRWHHAISSRGGMKYRHPNIRDIQCIHHRCIGLKAASPRKRWATTSILLRDDLTRPSTGLSYLAMTSRSTMTGHRLTTTTSKAISEQEIHPEYRCSRNDYRINSFWAWNLYL